MKKLRDVTDKVKTILTNNEKTRNNDNVLYLHVLRKYGEENGIDIDSMSIPMFFLHCNDLQLPSFKTVERARRLLQAKYPELRSDDNTQRARDELEMKYEKFSRRGG